MLYEVITNNRGEVSDAADYVLPLGKADIKREGTDVTLISFSKGIHHALGAAEELAKMKPAAFYLKEYVGQVETGNFDDDIAKLRERNNFV